MTADRLEEVPLFPLNVVLFPGARLPLRVFEERYKRLYSDALKDGARFGIVLIKEGREVGGPATPFDVGTLAEIEAVDHHDDSLFLLVRGTKRFRIRELRRDRPYLVGRVEVLEEVDVEDPGAAPAARGLARRFEGYVERLGSVAGALGGTLRSPALAAGVSPREVVHGIAFRLPLDPAAKQRLLETDDFETLVDLLDGFLRSEAAFLPSDVR